MKHTVALCGSYSGGNTEKLFKSLSRNGILQMSLVGREITLQVRSENLEEIKNSLRKLGVSNLSILEWKKAGVTLSNSGKGTDNDRILNISLIPSALDEGLRPLAFLCEFEINEKILEKIGSKIEDILTDAGITDAIYTVHIRERVEEKGLMDAVTVATLNAIFDAGGVVSIDQ